MTIYYSNNQKNQKPSNALLWIVGFLFVLYVAICVGLVLQAFNLW